MSTYPLNTYQISQWGKNAGASDQACPIFHLENVAIASDAQIMQFQRLQSMSPIRPINGELFKNAQKQYAEIATIWAKKYLEREFENVENLQPADVCAELNRLKAGIFVGTDNRPLMDCEFYFASKIFLPMAIGKLHDRRAMNGTALPANDGRLLRLVAVLYTLSTDMSSLEASVQEKENNGDLYVKVAYDDLCSGYQYKIHNYLDLERSEIVECEQQS